MRSLIAAIAAAGTLTACDDFREAMTAHIDVVARAGSQELSVDRLSALLGKAEVPVTKDVAKTVADLWVNYQLIGQAAAEGDSLNDSIRLDKAMWPIIAQARAAKLHATVFKNAASDTAATPKRYAEGEQLAASHILVAVPRTGATPAAKDSARRKAEALRAKVTSPNFAEVARQNSQDPGSAPRGGSLGIFPPGTMVPEFERALLALKPGEISPVVESPFGYHIIRRPTYDEVKDEFARAVAGQSTRVAERAYLEKLEKGSKVKFKEDAAQTIKTVARDLDAHREDNTVIATSTAGNFTAGRLARWIDVHPEQAQLREGIQNAPDSAVLQFGRNTLRNELVLHQADSAKITLDPKEMREIRGSFVQFVARTWNDLGVSPQTLVDSAKTEAARERLAAARIDSYVDRLLSNKAQFVDIPRPVAGLLREKYDWKLNQTGVDRALESAAKVRAKADSARASDRPATQVPLGNPGPGTQEPQGNTGGQRPMPDRAPSQAKAPSAERTPTDTQP